MPSFNWRCISRVQTIFCWLSADLVDHAGTPPGSHIDNTLSCQFEAVLIRHTLSTVPFFLRVLSRPYHHTSALFKAFLSPGDNTTASQAPHQLLISASTPPPATSPAHPATAHSRPCLTPRFECAQAEHNQLNSHSQRAGNVATFTEL